MPDEKKDRVELALEEIGFCPSLAMIVQDGNTIGIRKGRYERPKRHGVKIEIVIEEDIVR